ncbi:DnaJ domain-containing protein [Bdellovibrio sp. HCB-162]|uniref:J domain-containing protein n=1 Tax=Bdellovibrio sp. HCB-162 TaxID=3394234 RepID=UPI0039BCA806
MKWLILLLTLLSLKAFAQTADEVRRIMNPQSSLYEVLNVSQNATDDEIRAAYRRLMKSYHPDRYLNEPQKLKVATEVMKKINITRDTLMDPIARRRYDATVKTAPKATSTRASTTSTTSTAKKWSPPDFGTSEKPTTQEPPKTAEKPKEAPKEPREAPRETTSAAREPKVDPAPQKPQVSEPPPRTEAKAPVQKEPMDYRAKQAAKFYEETARCGDGAFFKRFVDVML